MRSRYYPPSWLDDPSSYAPVLVFAADAASYE
jgi:hypothetical protein